MRSVDLNLIDNGFDGEKAEILYEAMSCGQIQTLTMINKAWEFDYKAKELSNFKINVAAIKGIPQTHSNIRWE